MERATPEEFLALPQGRYVVGRSFVFFCADARFFGTLLAGCPAGEEIERWARVTEAAVAPDAVPHVSLYDASRLQAVDGRAYAAHNDFLGKRRDRFNRLIQRQAIVRPQGMAGATVAGYPQVSPATYPTRIFASAAEALTWIGRAEFEPSLRALAAELTSGDPVLRDVRGHLAHAVGSTLAQTCRTLGVSQRSLQRWLGAAGTTFQSEVARARIELAKRLLVETDLKLTAVALEVGCASSQHFSRLFRRWTGRSPSEWRAGRAGAGDDAPLATELRAAPKHR